MKLQHERFHVISDAIFALQDRQADAEKRIQTPIEELRLDRRQFKQPATSQKQIFGSFLSSDSDVSQDGRQPVVMTRDERHRNTIDEFKGY